MTREEELSAALAAQTREMPDGFAAHSGTAGRPMLSIVIPSWNTREHLARCIESVVAHTVSSFEIIVVDNGSTDGSIAMFEAWVASLARPEMARIVLLGENRGFAAACNAGAAVASGLNLLFLNSDTIVTPSWDAALVAALREHPELGALGPMSNFVSGAQRDPEARYETSIELAEYARERAHKFGRSTRETQRLVGFCIFIPRPVWDAVGGFDEQFFPGNYDDDDWCIRAIDAGYRLAIVPGSFVHHHGHATFLANRIDLGKSLSDNEERFLAKHPKRRAQYA